MRWSLDSVIVQHILNSVFLIVAVVLTRYTLLKALLGVDKPMSSDIRRRWIVTTRSVLIFVVLFGLIVIWATELRTVALSVVAVAAAIVLALKELILCSAGSFVRTISHSFSFGDRIEIDHLRGDVIDQTVFTTTILEIGPGHLTHQYTGRAITLPNSLFLTSKVVNESYTDEYVLHVFTVPIENSPDWKQASDLLLQISEEECAPFAQDASFHFEKLGKKQGLEIPTLNPRVTLNLPEPWTINLVVRICVPARRKGKVEQAILNRFMEKFARRHVERPD